MKSVTRVNITDPVLLRRLEVARVQMKDSTATKTATRLIESKLEELGIPLIAVESNESEQPRPSAA